MLLFSPAAVRANWAHEALNIEEAIAEVGQGEQVTVAVLSTGIDTDYPDLEGKLLPLINLTEDTAVGHDPLGQGTFLSGLIAANRGNDIGIDGICPWAKILPVKIINDVGTGTVETMAAGIRRAASEGADIILVGAGTVIDFPELKQAVREANNSNVLVVSGAGNNGIGIPFYPAAYDTVVSVAPLNTLGYTEDNELAFNRGSWVNLYAPGTRIKSIKSGGGTGENAGSSISAAFTAGVAAIKYSAAQFSDINRVKKGLLIGTGESVAPLWFDVIDTSHLRMGGKLDALRAIRYPSKKGGDLNMIRSFRLIPDNPLPGETSVIEVFTSNLEDTVLAKGEVFVYTGKEGVVDGSHLHKTINYSQTPPGSIRCSRIKWVPPNKAGYRNYPIMVSTKDDYTSDTQINETNLRVDFVLVNATEEIDLAIKGRQLKVEPETSDKLAVTLKVLVENRGSKVADNTVVKSIGPADIELSKKVSLKPTEFKMVVFNHEINQTEWKNSETINFRIRVDNMPGEQKLQNNSAEIIFPVKFKIPEEISIQ